MLRLESASAPPRAEPPGPGAMRLPIVASAAHILIVDRDRRVGLALSFMLAARRFDEVRAVRSVERALEITEHFRPHIVFLDLNLPDSGSIAVARQLGRCAYLNPPRLIALTKDAGHPMLEEARLAGFERFIVKPVSPQELDEVLGIPHATARVAMPRP